MPPGARVLWSRSIGHSIGNGVTHPAYEAFYSVTTAGYPNHPSSNPGTLVRVSAETGALLRVFNEWRVTKAPLKADRKIASATAAREQAFRLCSPSLRRQKRIVGAGQLSSSLMYVIPEGAPDARGNFRMFSAKPRYPAKAVLAHVVRLGGRDEIWLDAYTLEAVAYRFYF